MAYTTDEYKNLILLIISVMVMLRHFHIEIHVIFENLFVNNFLQKLILI